MPITGGIKFFNRSQSLAADGNEISASSGDAAGIRALDRNPFTYWRSVDSNDTVTETLTISFQEAQTFNRLLLADHNWESFNVKYFSGGMYVHFANVVGLDGAQSNITETSFADDTAYYEFDEVTTTSIQIEITTTQVADEEKYINQIIATSELGTLQGYPDIAGLKLSRNSREKKMLSGKTLAQKSEESFECVLNFKNYPASLSADTDLIASLYDREIPFLVWLCGGRRGASFFRKQLRAFRLRDIYMCQLGPDLNPDYSKNIYTGPVNFQVKVREAVD